MTRRSTATSGATARTTVSARPIASVPVEAAKTRSAARSVGERPLGDEVGIARADADADQARAAGTGRSRPGAARRSRGADQALDGEADQVGLGAVPPDRPGRRARPSARRAGRPSVLRTGRRVRVGHRPVAESGHEGRSSGVSRDPAGSATKAAARSGRLPRWTCRYVASRRRAGEPAGARPVAADELERVAGRVDRRVVELVAAQARARRPERRGDPGARRRGSRACRRSRHRGASVGTTPDHRPRRRAGRRATAARRTRPTPPARRERGRARRRASGRLAASSAANTSGNPPPATSASMPGRERAVAQRVERRRSRHRRRRSASRLSG